MKTSIKILLLVLFSIAAVAGVLVFIKTRVAPPSNISMENQYAIALKTSCDSFDSAGEFTQRRAEYIRLDDKLKRFLAENAIEPEMSDEYRKKIDETYGKSITDYGFGILKNSVWPEDKLNELLATLKALKADKLTTGESAVSEDFKASANKLTGILSDYHAALQLSRSTGFRGVSDASAKIAKARSYSSAPYLSNNTALTSALNALPGRIAQSHHSHVSGLVSSLKGYAGVSSDYYMNTLIPRADNAINEYKNTKIYGSSKPGIGDVESRAINYVNEAMDYYEN